MKGLAPTIRVLSNAAVLVLVVWIVLDLLGANSANGLVHWIRSVADWLAAWSRQIFSVRNGALQILLDYGIAAVVYAAVGNLLARAAR